MELKELAEIQREFDFRHGWSQVKSTPEDRFHAIQQDLIGMLGEMGELANVIKKLALEEGRTQGFNLVDELNRNQDSFKDEIADTFIYLMRIAAHLDVDIEKAYRDKLEHNEKRFKRFEQSQG